MACGCALVIAAKARIRLADLHHRLQRQVQCCGRSPRLVIEIEDGGIGRVPDQRDAGSFRDGLLQQLDPFPFQFGTEDGEAGDVRARPDIAGDEPGIDRIAARRKDDRDGPGRPLGGERAGGARGHDHVGPVSHQFVRQLREAAVIPSRPCELEHDVLALDVAQFAERLAQRVHLGALQRRGRGAKVADPRLLLRLLRPRRERPRRRAAEQRDELAPPHSITSSARASSMGGTSRPRALAVLRLITSSNFVGCCTGKSTGFAPFRTRPT